MSKKVNNVFESRFNDPNYPDQEYNNKRYIVIDTEIFKQHQMPIPRNTDELIVSLTRLPDYTPYFEPSKEGEYVVLHTSSIHTRAALVAYARSFWWHGQTKLAQAISAISDTIQTLYMK